MGRKKERKDKRKHKHKQKLVVAVSGKAKEREAEVLANQKANRRFFISLFAVFTVVVIIGLATSGSWMKSPPKGAGATDNVDNAAPPADNAPGDNQPGN